jgi:redox-sensitive bicupin YhaK (pirin superfamily)
MSTKSIISCIDKLGFPFKTLDPFLFCVFHEDHYPRGNAQMEAPIRGNGADFQLTDKKPYRMYHGDRVPGFPQHPHRGFETLTATLKGFIDHTDSLGNAGRYGEGDLQWLTTGKGVCHGEMFPLINQDKPNTTKFFQIWLNLPSSKKMVDPMYVMHWHEKIPIINSKDGLTKVIVWAGELETAKGLPPPPNSWGSMVDSELGVMFFELKPGAKYSIQPCKQGTRINRVLYFIEGEKVKIADKEFQEHCAVTVRGDEIIEIINNGTGISEILLLQGRPINEPVVQHGPFVMNTQFEIQQAFSDYQRTQFGGWPWPKDEMVFPKDKGRFTLQNNIEERP